MPDGVPRYSELVAEYERRLRQQLRLPGPPAAELKPVTTREYQEFKAEYLPKHISWYERAANLAERILRLRPGKAREAELQEAITICHLSITPSGAYSLAYLVPFAFIVAGLLLSLVFPVLLGFAPSMFFALFSLLVGVVLIFPLSKMPDFLANAWRMKASNQMVLCIFYIVMYMRHTSNLERGVEFASEHLGPPLALDLRKVLWDVETERFDTIKEALESYLATWKKWNMEFIEAFHLLEGSLYEGAEPRRLAMLDKALAVMLEETYEKMLHYAQNLKSPLTMLHMMGIVLPILGLVILPLVVSFMETVKWYHLAILYNIILPVGVFYRARSILSKRPTGYGEVDITEQNPQLAKYKSVRLKLGRTELGINPLWFSVFVGLAFFLVALAPLIIHNIIPDPKFDIVLMYKSEKARSVLTTVDQYTEPAELKNVRYSLLGYRSAKRDPSKIIGPFGLGASIASLAFPLALGLAIGLYYKLRSKAVIQIRENIKALETEFASALFQLGNRLGDGLPAELAFGKAAEVMEGTTSGAFFRAVELNIRRLGMGVEAAIFDPRAGAILQYPSPLIDSSMKVLIEAVRKGPRVAAQALVNVSRYVREMHRVDERLKDLMADIISDMKSQINYLTPLISGIVVGITSMITTIMGKLGMQLSSIQAQQAAPGVGPGAGLVEIMGDGVPTYFFQLMVGIYIVQIIYILTIMANGIENGADKLSEEYGIGQNVTRSTLLYVFVAFIVMLLFNTVAAKILRVGLGT